MSIMYLAKVNLTKGIFDVYDQKINIDTVISEIYNKLTDSVVYNTSANYNYRDSMGNRKKMLQKSQYGITELEKHEDFIITGKVLRTYDKPAEEVVNGKVKEIFAQENVSIYFYFDVKNELIAFSERQSFGYNQFMRAFEHILNKGMKGYKFEIFLQKDNDVLQQKLDELVIISAFKATLIPPNSNEDDLQMLRENLQYIADCKETNANKVKIEMQSIDANTSLKRESRYMQDIMKAVSKGYGDITTYGIAQNGKRRIISSNTDAALTRVIDENMGKKSYDDEAKDFITAFLRGVINKAFLD